MCVYVCVYEFMCITCKHAGASLGQIVSDLLEIKFQVAVNHLKEEVLGTEPSCSAKAVNPLNH